MRSIALIALALSAGLAHADRLFSIPTARKLPYGWSRFEYDTEAGSGRTQFGYLDLGIGTSFEASIHLERYANQASNGTVDLAYNIMSPIPGLSPGFALGIQDISDSTAAGRRTYLCTTFREPYTTLDGEVPCDITVGAYLHGPSAGFMGISLPFSKEFRWNTEYDGLRITTGFDLRVLPDLDMKLFYRDNDTILGLSYTTRS